MANLRKTRTLFAFTSPRSIEKIVPEIGLLCEQFAGKKWSGNSTLQENYFKQLFKSAFYEGHVMPKDPALAARDRITRAPKALGFVDLKPAIALTDAGKELLEGRRPDETITRQLLKFQLPSPYHQGFPSAFFVRPYLELIRLVRDLESISKTEIALFFIQLTHINKYDDIVRKVRLFRQQSKQFVGSRKTYVAQCFEREIKAIYKDEIRKKVLKTRESPEVSLAKFIRTKRGNMWDYADAFIRYLHATRLITFEKLTFRLIISRARKEDVDFILDNTLRVPLAFEDIQSFKAYLFNPFTIQLLSDDRGRLLERMRSLGYSQLEAKDTEELKDMLHTVEQGIQAKNIIEKKKELKSHENFSDIRDVFGKIRAREVPDAPLFLEWNVWRAFVMLNYALSVDGNFVVDIDGMPLNTAPGKRPDIEIDYENFAMIVEVTMSAGETQFRMENESVPRHFGRAKAEKGKELYCIFIAPSISKGALAHFFNLNRLHTRYYGGKTKIIPLNLEMFTAFIQAGVDIPFYQPEKLQAWLESLWVANQSCANEDEWFQSVKDSVHAWAA